MPKLQRPSFFHPPFLGYFPLLFWCSIFPHFLPPPHPCHFLVTAGKGLLPEDKNLRHLFINRTRKSQSLASPLFPHYFLVTLTLVPARRGSWIHPAFWLTVLSLLFLLGFRLPNVLGNSLPHGLQAKQGNCCHPLFLGKPIRREGICTSLAVG